MSMELRADLERLPRRMLGLKINDVGWPEPWLCLRVVDGVPIPDPEKTTLAIQRKLCYICGEKLGVHSCFLAGPLCGLNRASNEPPSHLECSRWMARNDPYLLLQDAVMLWVTEKYEVLLNEQSQVVFSMGEPTLVEWYSGGKPASRDQIMKSVEAGLPALGKLVSEQEDGEARLEAMLANFLQWVPVG